MKNEKPTVVVSGSKCCVCVGGGGEGWWLSVEILLIMGLYSYIYSYPKTPKAYIPLLRKIHGVGGWLWTIPLTPEFCVWVTNMLVSWSQREPSNLRFTRRKT